MGCGHSIYTDTDSVDGSSSGILKDREVEWTARPPWGRTWGDDDDDGEADEAARRRREERERRRLLRERALRKAQRDAALRRAAGPPCVVCKEDFYKWYRENYLPGCELAECHVTKDMKCGEDCVEDENEKDKCPNAKKPRKRPPCGGSCRL